MSEFLLEIITPEKCFFKGMVNSVVCCTESGEFGILKGHQPMVASLKVEEIRINIKGEWKYAFISEGFLEVRPDETIIFAQCGEWPEDIDENRAEDAKLRALSDIKHKTEITEHKHSQISLDRAITRLKIKNKNHL
ncbi:MAG: ATP synthase F1 subunit epsilon [Clostridia bacterium]|nr:ATP synthase F1 subunit epsilon [Clostridia bacterium]